MNTDNTNSIFSEEWIEDFMAEVNSGDNPELTEAYRTALENNERYIRKEKTTCKDCKEEITADNKSESFDNRCDYCTEKFFTNMVKNSYK